MADNLRDLALIINSRFPLVVVETTEEVRMMQLLESPTWKAGGFSCGASRRDAR